MSIPDGRCGFVLTEADASDEQIDDRRLIHGPYYDLCCFREVWKDHDRCIWHAQEERKPLEDLAEARSAGPERLDGAYLPEVRIGDRISFKNCTLHHVNFDGSYLEGISLDGSETTRSSFSRCQISHADLQNGRFVGVDFSDSNMQIVSARESTLSNCDFSGTHVDGDFRKSDIIDSDLSGTEKGPMDFRGARVTGCDFSNSLLTMCDMRYVSGGYNDYSNSHISGDFSYSKLDNSDFSECNISNSDFIGSHIEHCDFTNSIISESDFRMSDLYQSLLRNVRIDRSSTFGQHYLASTRPDFEIGKAIRLNPLWANKLGNWGGEDQSKLLEKRIWTLEALQEVKNTNTRFNDARKWYLLRKDAQREFTGLSGRWSNPNWWISTASKYIMGYGEKPVNVVITSIFVIFGFAFGYSSVGGIGSTQSELIAQGSAFSSENPHIAGLLESLYFSSITFSTLGYGDTYPATWSVRILATVESFIGALIMALLVFVLGRRTTW